MTEQRYLLDASALLAAIHNEKGGDYVQQRIEHSLVSSVNWSEVLQKLDRAGAATEKIAATLQALGLEVVAFNAEDARIAATLWPVTKSLGLSLADRACLATGRRLKVVVITADTAWSALADDQRIELIRHVKDD